MADPSTGQGVLGNLRAPSGSIVHRLAMRSLAEDQSGYGWTWENIKAGSTNPEIVAEMSSQTGNFVTIGTMTSPSFIGNLVGTAARASQADRATNADASDYASMVSGYYGGSGVSISPSFVPSNRVRFAMANVVPGVSFPTSAYRDMMLMDTYTGTDVPVTTAFAIDKNLQTKGAYLLWGTKGSDTWAAVQKILTDQNIGGYTAGAASKLETGRTIALSGAAIGTPTLFDGTENISIPVTGLDVSKLRVMTPNAYLPTTGSYSNGIYDLTSKYAVTLKPRTDGQPHDLYVASAAYADRAGSADTAANALKLGGYDAADYMRKDEVKTIKSSYETLEWDGAGTYSWTVPEGVTKINVTTVGGGGGAGYIRAYRNQYTSGTICNIFPGGNGGETIEGVVLEVKQGDQILVTIGSGGKTAGSAVDYDTCNKGGYGYYGLSPSSQGSGANGQESYISINNIKQTLTIAKGGHGADINNRTLSNHPPYTYPNSYYIYGNTSGTGKNGGRGARADTYPGGSIENGLSSPFATGGTSTNFEGKTIRNPCTGQNEYYEIGGGGGSYGSGAGYEGNMSAKRGGGGTHFSGAGAANGAPGYVKISYTRLYSN